MAYIYLIEPSMVDVSEIKTIQVPDGEMDFDFFKGYVNGYIEHLVCNPLSIGIRPHMLIDEEGKLKGLKYNNLATFYSGVYPYDTIVGNAILCNIIKLPSGEMDFGGFETDIFRHLVNELNC